MEEVEFEPQIREIEVTGTSPEQALEQLSQSNRNLGEILKNPNFPKVEIPKSLQNLPYSLSGLNNAQLQELAESAQWLSEKTPSLGVSRWLQTKILPPLQSILAASRPSNTIEIYQDKDKKPHIRILENLKSKE